MPRKSSPKSAKASEKAPENTGGEVRLLSGGNPQIAKADGDAPVQAYIAAMPEWKSDVGRRLDELIVRALPDVRKVVRWNSPFYGIEGRGWFLSYHVFTRYVKVTFLNGASLSPLPPVESRTRTHATTTSTRTARSTRSSLLIGLGRQQLFRVGTGSDGKIFCRFFTGGAFKARQVSL